MIFRTKPVEINAYKVDSQEGRKVLQDHLNAFQSKNLWDCWEIRTPSDSVELATKDDWIATDDQGGIFPIKKKDLFENYYHVGPVTHCLECGNSTKYEGIASLPLRYGATLCRDCTGAIDN